MPDRSNVKFYIMLLVATLGVIVPIWLSRPGTDARSLTLNVISRTAIESELPTPMAGIQFTVDGKALQRPYISVISLVNDGLLPLPASDYESPIEIHVRKGTEIIRSRITDTAPGDLQPKITHDIHRTTIQPLLTNPGDSVNIVLVTSGNAPEFTVRARIAGVKGVAVINPAPENQSSDVRLWLALATGFLLLVSYGLLLPTAASDRPNVLSRMNAMLVGLASAMGGAIILVPILKRQIGFPWWAQIAISLGFIVAAMITSSVLNRDRPLIRLR